MVDPLGLSYGLGRWSGSYDEGALQVVYDCARISYDSLLAHRLLRRGVICSARPIAVRQLPLFSQVYVTIHTGLQQ
jgi:hypothetical protein